MFDGYRCFRFISTVRVPFGMTPTLACPESSRAPRISILYGPGAMTINWGVRPTSRSLTKMSAPLGTERRNNLPLLSPALSSNSFRLTTSRGGPTRSKRCGDKICFAELGGSTFFFAGLDEVNVVAFAADANIFEEAVAVESAAV